MPVITALSDVVERLSQYWTHERVLSTATHLAGVTDNEIVQHDTIRHYINLSVSQIAEMLRVANSPFYGIVLTANFDRPNGTDRDAYPNGLYRITLADNTNLSSATENWYRRMSTIDRVTIRCTAVTATNPSAVYRQNAVRKDISELGNLVSNENTQSRYSIYWSHVGAHIHFLIGQGIGVEDTLDSDVDAADNDLNTTNYAYALDDLGPTDGNIFLWGQRKPILDDITLSPEDVNSGYKSNVDLPDEHIDLLVKMVQKKLLEHRREAVPQALEQEIQNATMMIRRQLNEELEFERAERQKLEYGSQQKAPGVV